MNILTINLVLSVFVFWLAARIYLAPVLPRCEPHTLLTPILLLHALRHLGLMFLAPGAVYPGLSPNFAYPAALGDLLAAVLAVIALLALQARAKGARTLVWVFNVVGSLDLVSAITLAIVYETNEQMGPAYWIPAFWVPALIVTHGIVFVFLVRHWRS